mgnify:CR=1 FL=1
MKLYSLSTNEFFLIIYLKWVGNVTKKLKIRKASDFLKFKGAK